MNPVRIGIIGLGIIGQQHADYLLAGKVRRCELAAVCSSKPEKLATFEARGLKIFSDYDTMLLSGVIDAVLIATPHYQHPALGIAAFTADLHVMAEKPIAAHKADAEKLVAAHHKNPRLKFAAMFQKRAEPCFLKMRELIQGGALGKIVRVTWLNTDWFRTEACTLRKSTCTRCSEWQESETWIECLCMRSWTGATLRRIQERDTSPS